MLRTQIYLPEELRKDIDKHRASNESLSEYIRKATEEKLVKDKKQGVNLKKLANELFSKPTISKQRATKWIKELRDERKREDRVLMKRLDRAWEKR